MRQKKSSRRPRKPVFRRPVRCGEPAGAIHADADAHPTTISIMAYGPDRLVEKQVPDAASIRPFLGQSPVLWVDVAGLRDAATIEAVGALFGLHPLALEDVINVHERPKAEDYHDFTYIVACMAPHTAVESTEQLSVFLGHNYVVTFQEKPGDCFEPLRDRIRHAKGIVRESGADYLAYSLLDAVVDDYYPQLEKCGEQLADIEDHAVLRPRRRLLLEIYSIRRRILYLRRAVWPLREVMAHLMREESRNFSRETRLFLRDIYDHTVQIIDLLETYHDLSSSLMDVYLSSVGNRMNEVVKLLTVITTVFIPLNFIAGVYGMNFHTDASRWNMPELSWQFGYPFCLGLMVAIAVGQLLLFWHKGWFAQNAIDEQTVDEHLTR